MSPKSDDPQILIGTSFVMCGALVRIFVDKDRFYFALIGACLSGIGQPFL